jgi:poly(hydroxyalkanoate) granule-associated protein
MNAETLTPGADRLRQIRDTGRSLWLAGLGAVAELEKEGKGLFDQLVERGRPLEHRGKQAVDEIGGQANAKLREMGQLMRDQVRYDVKRVLTRVGLPTSEDFSQLAVRLEALSLKIDEFALSTVAPGVVPTQPRAAAK